MKFWWRQNGTRKDAGSYLQFMCINWLGLYGMVMSLLLSNIRYRTMVRIIEALIRNLFDRIYRFRRFIWKPKPLETDLQPFCRYDTGNFDPLLISATSRAFNSRSSHKNQNYLEIIDQQTSCMSWCVNFFKYFFHYMLLWLLYSSIRFKTKKRWEMSHIFKKISHTEPNTNIIQSNPLVREIFLSIFQHTQIMMFVSFIFIIIMIKHYFYAKLQIINFI